MVSDFILSELQHLSIRQVLSGLLAAFIDYLPFPQGGTQDGADYLPMLLNILLRCNHNINGRQDAMQIAVNFLCQGTPVYRAAHDYQKGQIAIFVGLAARGGTKEQNALGLAKAENQCSY